MNKTKLVAIRMTQKMYKDIKKRDINLSELVRLIVQMILDNYDKKVK